MTRLLMKMDSVFWSTAYGPEELKRSLQTFSYGLKGSPRQPISGNGITTIQKKWQEFREKYRDELKDNDFLPNLLSQIRRKKNVTLLFAARDLKYNQAIILKEVLEEVLA